MEALGRGRVEVVCAGQDSACFLEYLEALTERHRETGREVILALDNNSSCHTSGMRAQGGSRRAGRVAVWVISGSGALHSPHLNLKEREWRRLKGECRSHLAGTLRGFVDGILAGLARLG